MFKTINTKFLKDGIQTDIQNLEACDDHWGSSLAIIKIIEELELILCKANTFIAVERELIMFLLTLNKQNPRLQEMKFYTALEPIGTFICVCVSDITTFKPEYFLKRNIIIDLHKQNKRLLFTDVTKEEWDHVINPMSAKKLKLPSTWQANKALTDKYNKLKELFL